ncbi:hypothetical protein [Lysobacter gummosus]|uniref:hypothetical protein n=1 Tax=Lysobacter gummosus TaxID=262324 RepID=UPI00363C29DA
MQAIDPSVDLRRTAANFCIRYRYPARRSHRGKTAFGLVIGFAFALCAPFSSAWPESPYGGTASVRDGIAGSAACRH